MTYRFLLNLAIILLSTKLLGLVTRKIKMPQVVGALMAGLLLGPSVLNVLTETQFVSQMSELGVIVILFTAGMGTDIGELKKTGKAGFFVALCGVIVPLALGALFAYLSARVGLIEADGLLFYIFVGTVLTATSVSITVETLKELGHLNSTVGNTILAAALIDDVLGLIVLTVITGFSGGDTGIGLVLLKILLFFVFAFVVHLIATKLFDWMISRAKGRNLHRYPLLAFVLCLLMAYSAEEFFGVSDIIGAFAAGLVVASTPKAKYIESKFEPISYLLLTPIFFASIGINAVLPDAGTNLLVFSVLLLVIAVVSKLIGCGIGARVSGFRGRECTQIGVGMACRGEVALIVANKGVALGVIGSTMMAPFIVMVIGCAVLTPIMLKLVFRNTCSPEPKQSRLAYRYGSSESADIATEHFIGDRSKAFNQAPPATPPTDEKKAVETD